MKTLQSTFPGTCCFTLRLAQLLCFIVSGLGMQAAAPVPFEEWQRLLGQGGGEQVRQEFERALEKDPGNPHLLYNRAVALYSLGRYEESLLDLDLVVDARPRSLARKAAFQKANAEFHLGIMSLTNDVEVTLARWKESVSTYQDLLKDQPGNGDAQNNLEHVRRRLLELLMKNARENLEEGKEPTKPAEQRIPPLRQAMEQFHDATKIEPSNPEAKQGEVEARDLLAKALAEEGTKKTLANQMVMPGANEPMVMRPDTQQIREGVNMLEDANSLKPNDPDIAQQLEEGRERLADALTLQARIYLSVEPRIRRNDDKLGVLRMAMEQADKALEQVPDHQQAKAVREQIRKRLGELHEQLGDQAEQQAEDAPLEQQAQQLSQALDHFQQASGMRPQDSKLPQKAQKAQQKLEQALEQLGDQLMKPGGEQESLEEQAMRLEGAEQAFNELQSLKPSDETAEKGRQAGKQLGQVREKLAANGKPNMPQPGGQEPGQSPPMMPQDMQTGLPMDAPPRLDSKVLRNQYRSPAMNRSLRDY